MIGYGEKQAVLYHGDHKPAEIYGPVERPAIYWNQLMNRSKISVAAYYDYSLENDIYELTANSVGNRLQNTIQCVTGHIYFMFAIVKNGDGNTVSFVPYSFGNVVKPLYSRSNTSGEWARIYYMLRAEYSGSLLAQFMISTKADYPQTAFYKSESFNVFDLTAMFGEGYEPATVQEFEKVFPENSYPLNKGEWQIAPNGVNTAYTHVFTDKFTGWKETERTGTEIIIGDTYDDTLTELAVKGQSVQISRPEIRSERTGDTQYCFDTVTDEGGAIKTQVESLTVYGRSVQETGYAVKLNQLIPYISSDRDNTHSSKYDSDVDSMIITNTGTTTAVANLKMTEIFPVQSGHYFYSKYQADFELNGNTVYAIDTSNNVRIPTTGAIYKITNGTAQCRIRILAGNQVSGRIRWTMIDLTEMFGEGNEPSTTAQFEKLYPAAFYQKTADDWQKAPDGVMTGYTYPRPELSAELKSVSGLVCCDGINLLNPANYTGTTTQNGIQHRNNEDGTYTLNGTSDVDNTAFGVLTVNRNLVLQAGRYRLYGGLSNEIYIQLKGVVGDVGIANDYGKHPEFTITAPTAIRYNIRVWKAGTVLKDVLVAPMIVRSEINPTDFVPYSAGSGFEVPVLRSLPDGTSDVLHVDRLRKRAWIERNVDSVVFTGKENWSLPTGLVAGFSEYRLTDFFHNVPSSVRCSHFEDALQTTYTSHRRNVLTSFTQTKQLIILVSNDIADAETQTTVEAWKAWLAEQYQMGTPVTVFFPLAEPTIEEQDYSVYTLNLQHPQSWISLYSDTPTLLDVSVVTSESPSPEWKSDIHSMSGGIESVGQNLFPADTNDFMQYGSYYGIPIKRESYLQVRVKPGKTIPSGVYFGFIRSKGSATATWLINEGKISPYWGGKAEEKADKSYLFQIAGLYVDSKEKLAAFLDACEVMLSEGGYYPYVPYRASTKISFPVLRRLPDGTCDCLYVDKHEKRAWVERRIGTYEYTGTETLSNFQENEEFIRWGCGVLKNRGVGNDDRTALINSHFHAGVDMKEMQCSLSGMAPSQLVNIVMPKSLFPTSDSVKTWLREQAENNTPVQVLYKLYTPIIEELPFDENLLKTYPHQTVIRFENVDNCFTPEMMVKLKTIELC